MSFLLLFAGLFLIFLEFYLPGAILGTLGGITILYSFYLFAVESHSLWETFAFILGSIFLLGIVVKFTLWTIIKQKGKHTFYSEASQHGYQASFYNKNAIGKKGIVLSDLKPGGYILVDGEQSPAISLMGYIPKGEEVEVVDGQEQSLMVKLAEKELTS